MKKNKLILITFFGIILTLFKQTWFLGILIMITGFYLIGKEISNHA